MHRFCSLFIRFMHSFIHSFVGIITQCIVVSIWFEVNQSKRCWYFYDFLWPTNLSSLSISIKVSIRFPGINIGQLISSLTGWFSCSRCRKLLNHYEHHSKCALTTTATALKIQSISYESIFMKSNHNARFVLQFGCRRSPNHNKMMQTHLFSACFFFLLKIKHTLMCIIYKYRDKNLCKQWPKKKTENEIKKRSGQFSS